MVSSEISYLPGPHFVISIPQCMLLQQIFRVHSLLPCFAQLTELSFTCLL